MRHTITQHPPTHTRRIYGIYAYGIAALEVATHAPSRVGLLRQHVHARGQFVDVDAGRCRAARRWRALGGSHATVNTPEGWGAAAEARLALASPAAVAVALSGVALDLAQG